MEPKIKIKTSELLSDNYYVLKKHTFSYEYKDTQNDNVIREVYDRGNGAVILLYNPKSKNVILTRQFRLPTYLNKNKNGMMIEACAGVLDEDSPEECIIRETKEETGYEISHPKKIFESYMSPGAITEILYFYVAEYYENMKVSQGGGLDKEQEDIEVIEMKFEEAYQMIADGKIKDSKTIMLLQYAKIHDLINKTL